jgi:acylglycerol lipase
MAERGVAVFSGDVIGHGKSGGDRVFFQSLEDMISDFETLCNESKKECFDAHGQVPMFIGGHSLGGLIAPLTCLKNQSMWSGLLLCSPALDVEWNLMLRIQAVLSNILSATIPRTRLVPKLNPFHMNKDPEKVEEYLKDELVYVGPLPVRTGHQTLRGFKMLSKERSQFTLPIYAHHGDKDRVTMFKATKEFMDAVPSTDKMFEPIENGFHEVLFEEKANEILDNMIEWILQHSAAASRM